MQSNNAAALRLKAVAEADPSTLVRMLQFFQARNVVPRRVRAHCVGAEILELELEIDRAQIEPDAFRIIVAKLNELPTVWAAVVCD